MSEEDSSLVFEHHPSPSGRGGKRGGGKKWVVLICLALAGGGLMLSSPVRGKIVRLLDRLRQERIVEKERIVEREKIVEREVRVPVPVNPPPPSIPSGPALGPERDVGTMFGGLQIKAAVVPEPGEQASKERMSKGSYSVEFNVRVKVPKPATTMEEFTALNPALPTIFPVLKDLLPSGKVSGFYQHMYKIKQAALKDNIMRLNKLLTRHDFFDLESVMELQSPQTKQKALLVQGEMDVVSDGSDGDRMESFDMGLYRSHHFQPSTSYSWAKLTPKLNPLIPVFEEDLRLAKERMKNPTVLSAAEKASLQYSLKDMPRRISDLKKRSYLIASEDPFIVISLAYKSYKGGDFTPSIGDYAVVLVNDKAYPAVIGDYGPETNCGEASLRMARQVDPRAGPYNRPISDLRVSYLLFPNTADQPLRPPDYEAWHKKCSELFAAMGGDPAKLFKWEDRIKKAAEEKAKAEAAKAAAAVNTPPNPAPGTATPPAARTPAAPAPPPPR